MSNSCSNKRHLFISDELKCWVQSNYTNTQIPKLQQSENISDAVECINKCKEVDFCSIVDMNRQTTPQCWYHHTNQNVVLAPSSSVTNYLLDLTCDKITAGVGKSNSKCGPKWIIVNKYCLDNFLSYFSSSNNLHSKKKLNLSCWTVTAEHRILGKGQRDKKTLAECLKDCIGFSECWSVD